MQTKHNYLLHFTLGRSGRQTQRTEAQRGILRANQNLVLSPSSLSLFGKFWGTRRRKNFISEGFGYKFIDAFTRMLPQVFYARDYKAIGPLDTTIRQST